MDNFIFILKIMLVITIGYAIIIEEFGKENAKIYLKTVFIIIIMTVVYVRINAILTNPNKTEIILNTKEKFIMYECSENNEDFYYEIDLKKNSIIKRRDIEKVNRTKVKKIKENCKEIKKMVKQIVNDENNLIELSSEERDKFYKENIDVFYLIKDYRGNIYYLKDTEQTKQMKELLE